MRTFHNAQAGWKFTIPLQIREYVEPKMLPFSVTQEQARLAVAFEGQDAGADAVREPAFLTKREFFGGLAVKLTGQKGKYIRVLSNQLFQCSAEPMPG